MHALRGIGKWAKTVGPGLGNAVAGLVTKPLSAIGKGVFGLVGAIGQGVVSVGREIVSETRVGGEEVVEEVSKTGIVGFLKRSVARKG